MMSVWATSDRLRWFLIPDGTQPVSGALSIHDLEGRAMTADPEWLVPYEVTEDQARRWAKDDLGRTLDELKTGLDEKLAELRGQLETFNRTPVSEDTTITPNAAPALLDFVKALPRVVGQSISGDRNRVARARHTMAGLHRRLKEAGIDVDDRVKDFPDRLASLRDTPQEPED